MLASQHAAAGSHSGRRIRETRHVSTTAPPGHACCLIVPCELPFRDVLLFQRAFPDPAIFTAYASAAVELAVTDCGALAADGLDAVELWKPSRVSLTLAPETVAWLDDNGLAGDDLSEFVSLVLANLASSLRKGGASCSF